MSVFSVGNSMFNKCFLKIPGIVISIFLLYACSSSGGGESSEDADDPARFDPSSYREAPDSGNLTGSWVFLSTNVNVEPGELGLPEKSTNGRIRSIAYIIDNGDGTGSIDRCNLREPRDIEISDGKITISTDGLTLEELILEGGLTLNVYSNSRIGGDYLSKAETILSKTSTGHIEAIKVDNSLNHNFGTLFNISGSDEHMPSVSNTSEPVHCFYEEYSEKTYYTIDSSINDPTTTPPYTLIEHIAPHSILKMKTENYAFHISERLDSTGFDEFYARAETPWGNFKAVQGNNPDRNQNGSTPTPYDIYGGTSSVEFESTVDFVNSTIHVTNGGDSVSAELSVQF